MSRPAIRSLAVPATLALLAGACRSPDYGRPLGPGEPALLKVDIAKLDLPLAEEWSAREEILPALDNSIFWTRRKHAQQFFPMAGIDHARALASLERVRELLATSADGAEFASRFRTEFDAYKSAGWNGKGGGVLFTGYCTPILQGSLEKTPRFRHPLYALPPDLVKDKEGKTLGWRTAGGLVPYPSRSAIEGSGLLDGQGLELAWLEDPVDAYVAHVNGSAFIHLPDGTLHRLGYAGKNGRPYTSLGRELVLDGVVPKGKMNLSAIRTWAASAAPESLYDYLHRNESFVFFQPIAGNPHGSLDVEVTAQRSLATDKTLFPRGALVFVDADEIPGPYGGTMPLRRLMFDQDTGGAIRTAGRADVYFGVGDEAEELAGRVQSEGQLYYFFLKERPQP